MDKSKRYIEMCKSAKDLLDIKWDFGFIDGDWIYLGESGVKVLGFDSISMGQSVVEEPNGKKKVEIELSHSDGIEMISEKGDIDINVLNYPIDSYINPIWLPRQDQLESFYYQAILKRIDIYCWLTEINQFIPDHSGFKSMEQVALGVIMKLRYNKVWNDWSWKEIEEDEDADLPF